MKNRKQLLTSRKKVLEIADYIIPGHGKMFKVKRYKDSEGEYKDDFVKKILKASREPAKKFNASFRKDIYK